MATMAPNIGATFSNPMGNLFQVSFLLIPQNPKLAQEDRYNRTCKNIRSMLIEILCLTFQIFRMETLYIRNGNLKGIVMDFSPQ